MRYSLLTNVSETVSIHHQLLIMSKLLSSLCFDLALQLDRTLSFMLQSELSGQPAKMQILIYRSWIQPDNLYFWQTTRPWHSKDVNTCSIPISAGNFLWQTSGVRGCVVHVQPLLEDKEGWAHLHFHAGQAWVLTPSRRGSLSD